MLQTTTTTEAVLAGEPAPDCLDESAAGTRAPAEHPAIEQLLRGIELTVLTSYTLADAIREGASVTKQAIGTWGSEDTACTLSAAYLAARAHGYVKRI